MSKYTDAQRSLKIIIESMTDEELANISERLKELGWNWQAFLLEQEITRRSHYPDQRP